MLCILRSWLEACCSYGVFTCSAVRVCNTCSEIHVSEVGGLFWMFVKSIVRNILVQMAATQVSAGLYTSNGIKREIGSQPEDLANQRCRGCESLCYEGELARDQW